MYSSDLANRPPLHRFGDDFADLALHNIAIRFVLQLEDTVTAGRVIPNGSGEQNGASSCRIGHEIHEVCDADRFLGNRNMHRRVLSYALIAHRITIMSNDTPESTPDDSQAPFISERNEPHSVSVSSNMDDTAPQQPTGDRRQVTADSDESTGLTASVDSAETTEAPDAAGETDTVDVSQPLPTPSSLEPSPTVDFDYDDYYYGLSDTAPRPEPVSARIEPAKAKGRSNGTLFFLGALAAGVLGSLITLGVLTATGTFSDTENPTSTTIATAAPTAITPQPQVTNNIINDIGSAVNPTAVALKVIPSIVTVSVFQQGTGDSTAPVPTGSGSGVVISKDGYIVTNHHVVVDATDFEVTFEDGRVYTAQLIGSDELTDLAVLQISSDDLVPIETGSSEDLALGDPVIAVGNPLAQAGGASVSSGIVSAFDRQVDFGNGSSLFGMIQTDAAINSGSSGGALVNAEGKLVGITSAIGVSTAGPEGIGYAIPVELVERITDEIIETGDVVHPFLGVTIGTYTDEAPDGATVPAGADIQTIEGTDSAAGQAGLQPGDIIIRIGNKPISNQTDLILAVRLYRVGDKVEFEALRNGESMTFSVVMGQRPAEFGG